jgi:hypothetical protein
MPWKANGEPVRGLLVSATSGKPQCAASASACHPLAGTAARSAMPPTLSIGRGSRPAPFVKRENRTPVRVQGARRHFYMDRLRRERASGARDCIRLAHDTGPFGLIWECDETAQPHQSNP